MNALEAALARDDDYASVRLWLDHALTRDNVAGLVFDLELVFGVLLNRSPRAHLPAEQVDELHRRLKICRHRCERHLPPHASTDDVRAGFAAADHLLKLWLSPLDARSSHTIEQEPYAGVLRFHGVLRALRRGQALPTAAVIVTKVELEGCEVIPFPKPYRGHTR